MTTTAEIPSTSFTSPVSTTAVEEPIIQAETPQTVAEATFMSSSLFEKTYGKGKVT